ncbi:MAG: hypothetical protein MUC87_03195 [Bacteroidia bacterium]|jgi:hypothetical protein|nr:hypothetical protein [Bacteroidia bacterium]
MKKRIFYFIAAMLLANSNTYAIDYNFLKENIRIGIHSTHTKTAFTYYRITDGDFNKPYTFQSVSVRSIPAELYLSAETKRGLQVQLGGGINCRLSTEQSLVPVFYHVNSPLGDQFMGYNNRGSKYTMFYGTFHCAVNWMFYRNDKVGLGIGIFNELTGPSKNIDTSINLPVRYRIGKRTWLCATSQLTENGLRMLAGVNVLFNRKTATASDK